MAEVLAEDEFGTTVSDGGRIFVVPRGILNLPSHPVIPSTPLEAPPMPGMGGGAPAPAPLTPLADAGDAIGTIPGRGLPPSGPGQAPLLAPGEAFAPPTPAPPPAPVKGKAGTLPSSARQPEAPPPPTVGEQVAAEGAAGYDQQGQAIADQAAIEGQAADERARILGERNDELARIDKAREAQVAADMARAKDLDERVNTAVEAEANYKIDENRRWHDLSTGRKVLAGISVALAGLGEALSGHGGKNPALDFIVGEIERDTRNQYAQAERLRGKIGIATDTARRFSEVAKDHVAQINMLSAAQIERTARDIEATAAQYDSPKAKAQAKQLAGDLRVKKAEYVGNAVNAEWQRDFHEREFTEQKRSNRAQQSISWANLKQADRFHTDEMKLRTDAMLLDAAKLDQSGAVEGAKALREQAKEERELSVGGVATMAGTDAKGAPIVRVQPLKNADGSIYLAPDSTAARDIRKAKAATDVVVHFIDDTRRIIKAEGGMTNLDKNAAWQEVQSNKAMIGNSLRVAYEMGALDKGALQQMEAMLGGVAPTGWQSYVFDPGAGFAQVREQALVKLNATLNANNYTGERYDIVDTAGFSGAATTPAGEAYKAVVADQTRDERVAAEKGGGALQAAEAPFDWVAGNEGLEARRARLADEGTPEDLLLGNVTKAQGENIRTLIARAKTGDADARQGLVALASGTRAGLAQATLKALGDDGDPLLLAGVVSEMPQAVRGDRSHIIETATAHSEGQRRDHELEARGLAGDPQALAQLALIAVSKSPGGTEGLGWDARRKWARSIITRAPSAGDPNTVGP